MKLEFILHPIDPVVVSELKSIPSKNYRFSIYIDRGDRLYGFISGSSVLDRHPEDSFFKTYSYIKL